MKNIKLGTKLALSFGILVLLTLAIIGVNYIGNSRATNKINITGDLRVPAALIAAHAQDSLLKMMSDTRAYLALGEAKYKDSYAQNQLEFEADFAKLKIISSDLPVDDQQRITDLEKYYYIWLKLPPKMFELRDDQIEREPAYKIMAIDSSSYIGEMLIDLNSLADSEVISESNNDTVKILQVLLQNQTSLQGIFAGIRGYVTTRNRIYRLEFDGNLTVNQNAWERLNSFKSKLNPTQQELLDKIAKNRDSFQSLPDKMFSILESPQWRTDLYIFSSEAEPQAEKMQILRSEEHTSELQSP